ncbi:MAG: efflux transporter outer membrane subunit [Bacteroidales bacterium]|nr:efflux transporter outer membrane subunit [Bacteroidales bacterium]
MHTRHIFLPILTVWFFAGCGIYNSYERDDMPVADSLYRTADSQQALDTLPQWDKFFSDPYLKKLIERGLASNADMRMATLAVDRAQASLSASRLAYLPSLNLAGDASLDHFNDTSKKTYAIGAEASWQIDIFGRLTNARRAAKAALLQSESYRQAVQARLVATIAESYYSLLLLDAQIEIASQTVVNWRQTTSTLEALKEAGRSNEAAVQQTRAQQLSLEADLVTLRHQLYTLENSLCALLMEPPHAVERGSLKNTALPQQLATGLPAQLLNNRPDLQQAEAVLMEHFYNVEAARAAFFPMVTLSGTLGWTNSHSGISVNPAQIFVNLAGSLLQPVFNRGTLRANYRVAQANRQAALTSYQQALLNAGNEVNEALSQCQTSAARIALDTSRVAALTRAVEHTTSLMSYGSSSYLEVLTAQQSLLTAQLTLADDRYRQLAATASLYQALGGR